MPPYEQILAENVSLKEENASLKVQIDWLKRQLFGGGKSEKLDRAQMLLKLEQLEEQASAQRARIEKISYERTKSSPHERLTPAEAFAHLPVKETITIEPEEVKAEPQAYERIGEERTFEVDVTPPRLFKREFVRPSIVGAKTAASPRWWRRHGRYLAATPRPGYWPGR